MTIHYLVSKKTCLFKNACLSVALWRRRASERARARARATDSAARTSRSRLSSLSLSLSPLLWSADMANVADTKLYDILGVSPSATENELKKVETVFSASRFVE